MKAPKQPRAGTAKTKPQSPKAGTTKAKAKSGRPKVKAKRSKPTATPSKPGTAKAKSKRSEPTATPSKTAAPPQAFDPAALLEIETLFDELRALYFTGDAADIERKLQEVLTAIEQHPRLNKSARSLLRTRLLREHALRTARPQIRHDAAEVDVPPPASRWEGDWPGRTTLAARPGRPHISRFKRSIPERYRDIDAPWDLQLDPAFELDPDSEAPPSPRSMGATRSAPAPRMVHWSTRLLDGDTALDGAFITVGRLYTIETGLNPEALANALAVSALDASLLPDGTEVTFEASCSQPILRGHEDPGGALTSRVAWRATYSAATGRCPPARFGLVAAAPGRISFVLSLSTKNAVRASTSLALLAEPAPAAPPARIVPAAPPPPLPAPPTVEIWPPALLGPAAELRLELTPTNQIVISDGRALERPRDPSAGWGALIPTALDARRRLVALAGRYRHDPARPSTFALLDGPALCLEMARIGADLHEAFFGTPDDGVTDLDVQRLARAIADTPDDGAPARLQIVAAFQPFPWAVFYDGAYRGKPLTNDPASVDLSCFWGHRFRIDRMIMGHAHAARPPILPDPVRVQTCLNRHLDDEPGAKALGVKVIAQQRALLANMSGVQAHPPIESTEDFLSYLRSESACDLLYVFCHAKAAVTRDSLFTFVPKLPDLQARLVFDPEPAPPVDVRTMQDTRTGHLLDRPLVFLNACSSAAGDEMFQSPMLELFLSRWGAAGVLGTDWEVPIAFADPFARRLLHHFLHERQPLGEALWRAGREAFAEGNPFPLVYALYARPELAITAPTPTDRGSRP